MEGSYSWYANTGMEYVMYKDLSASTVEAVRGQKVMFSFWFHPDTVAADGSQNQARAEIVSAPSSSGGGGGGGGFCRPGCPVGPQSSSDSPEAYGVWMAPTQPDWYVAYVELSVPSDTSTIRVFIRGRTNFMAHIDVAQMAIVDTVTQSFAEGNIGLSIHIYHWQILSGPEPRGFVFLVAALHTEALGSYRVMSTQLKVELLPHDGSSTPQNGFLDIRYAGQGNDRGYEVDPQANEEVQNQNLETATSVIASASLVLNALGLAIATAVTGGAAIPVWVAVGTQAAGVGTTALAITLLQFKSNPYDPSARGGTDYSVHERWDYPRDTIKEYEQEPWVKAANGHYSLDWRFNTESATSFFIRAEASVNWGQRHYHSGCNNICIIELHDVGWDSIASSVAVYA